MRRITILAASLAAVAALGLGASSAMAADSPSLADDVAAKLGISAEQLRAAFKAARVARIDAGVAAGRLTQEQATKLKERIAKSNGLGVGLRKAFSKKQQAFAKRIAAKGKGLGAAADFLGLDKAEVRAELQSGKSLAKIAAAEGKSVEGLVNAMLAPAKERLTKAVADKRLTQQRADELIERLTERVEKLVRRSRTS